MDIKQQRAFRTFKRQRTVRTSNRKGFQDQDIRGMRINGTSSSRGNLGIKQGLRAAGDERSGGQAPDQAAEDN